MLWTYSVYLSLCGVACTFLHFLVRNLSINVLTGLTALKVKNYEVKLFKKSPHSYFLNTLANINFVSLRNAFVIHFKEVKIY